MKTLLCHAKENHCAVGAFSVGNMEMILGAVRAAEELEAPIILQIAEKRLPYSPLSLMGPMMVAAAKKASVPIAVHLDHGLTMACVREALACGFTSVMLDGSLLPYEENISVTASVVDEARKYGATVEAELGVVGGNEGDTAEHKITCTDPATAADFCVKTGIDALAVAIGNAHGNYPVLPALRFDILKKIGETVSVPLVLHGGTGITDEMFRKAISLGIRKINIATASFDAYAKAAASYAQANDTPDYFALSASCSQAVYNNVKRHIRVFRMDG